MVKRQIRIEGDVAYISLTKGYEAAIDAADVPLVEGFDWLALPRGGSAYAYRTTHSPRKTIYLHRLLVAASSDLHVDHIDGNRLNNRRGNLRLATRHQNMQNQKLATHNTSGLKGAGWSKSKGKFRSRIVAFGKEYHLGFYNSAEEAHAAYARASAKLHGAFGRVE